MPRSLPMLLPAAIALLGCGSRDASEEAPPPMPAAATAIPTAAPGAQGAQFNAPTSLRATARPRGPGPLGPSPPPDEPFGTEEPEGREEPALPEAPGKEHKDGGTPAARPKKKGVKL